MSNRTFLMINVFVWLPYGLFCLVSPGFLADAAGVTASSTTGTIELRAMYGGLQAAIGALCLLATRRPELERTALYSVAFIASGLLLGRISGVAIGAEVSAYTGAALGFEITLAAVSAWLLSKSTPVAA